MVYEFKNGARLPVSAQVAGEEFARLESRGMLTPANLVDANRAEDAPLHKCFEWNDGIAAEKWRQTQASYIIRSIEVSVKSEHPQTRAFVPVALDGSRRYQSIGAVLQRSDSREVLLEQARRELLSFTRKYNVLKELSGVFAAIDGFVGKAPLESRDAAIEEVNDAR